MGIPTHQATGTPSYSTGSGSVSWPTHVADDVGLLVMVNKYDDSDFTAPAGWAHISGSPFNDPGASLSADNKLQILWKRATSSSEPAVSYPDPGTHTAAVIVTFRGCTPSGDPFLDTAVSYEGHTDSPSFPSVTVSKEDALVVLVGESSEDAGLTLWNTPTNANLTNLTQLFENGFTTGLDGEYTVFTAEHASGTGATGVTTTVNNGYNWRFISVSLVLEGILTVRPAYEIGQANSVFEPTNPVQPATTESDSTPAITAAKAPQMGVSSETGSADAVTFRKFLRPVVDTSSATAVAPARILSMGETLSMSASTPLGQVGPYVRESLELAYTASAVGVYARTLAETLLNSDYAILGWPISLADTVNVSEALTGALGMTVAEDLGITQAVAPSLKFGISTADTLSIQDALARFLSGVAADTLNLTPSFSPSWLYPDSLADTLEVTPAVSGTLVFRITASDSLSLTDEELLSWIFSGSIDDTVEFALGAISPTGDFTAWAVNTSTTAITEYSNFNFNSFAEMYPHYLAASSSGLYTLDGDTDAGTDIIGKVRSGYAQFSGSRLSSLDVAYLGLRGDGEYVFRIVTADGQTYNYSATTSSMETARVQLGRGLRARYIAFELESTGADFDLESVEILPLALSRRV